MATPYIPRVPGSSSLRHFYTTTAQVLRLAETRTAGGGMIMSWAAVASVVDPSLDTPGLLACRIDLTHLRPGKDAPPVFTAGRAPDRVGVCYFDLASDGSGAPLVLAGDRLEAVSGPIYGTFEIRQIPDVAQDLTGAHHVEVQVTEVAQQLGKGTPTPFPGTGP